jgi:hypothetical protein
MRACLIVCCALRKRPSSRPGERLDQGLPLRKMTTHAELAVRTTLREAYSDGSLRFGA